MFDIILCDSIRKLKKHLKKIDNENDYAILFKVC